MEILGYIASFAMGITLGLMGGGGSILTVPIMVYLFGLKPVAATGHSLFVVGVTALIGSIMYIRRKDIDFKVGFSFALPSVIGVSLSRSLIIPKIPDIIVGPQGFTLSKEALIMVAFAALMISASYSMIKKRSGQKSPTSRLSLSWTLIAFKGLIVGMIAGFVGAGGGFLIIPALVLLTGLPMRVAVGTSLLIIAFQSLLGFANDLIQDADIQWTLLGTVTSIAAAGIVLGSAIAHKMKEQSLKAAFGWFVLVMGAFILIEQLYHLF